MTGSPRSHPDDARHGLTNAVVHAFLHSNLSLILLVLAAATGVTAPWVTPREEDPQIVVPLADVYVEFPGHTALEVEQLVATPLEKLLFEIDGVEYVYSMSRETSLAWTRRRACKRDGPLSNPANSRSWSWPSTTTGMGWRESLIVALAVPVVFGLTLTVNMLFDFTINRVTLFALILSLGLLVDDPIVDVENISRHFALHGRATRDIVLQAVAEIRPPLITAALAVIVSFLPMLFITGMMGMIALAGIVTRDAIMESRVVRLRPILLTAC